MYQKIIIVGNLGGDPQMRYMPDGTAVTSFSVATNRRWNDRNGQQVDETTWFRISAWGRQAETANEYLSKGKQVLVEGRIKPDPATGGPRMWTGQDGTLRASFEVVADSIRFIGSRDGATGSYSEEGEFVGATAGGSAAQEEDDIPF
jgi:single-strand DNA-binding protein